MRTRAARTFATSLILFFAASAWLAAQAAEQEWYVGKPISDFTFTGLVTVKADDMKAIVKPYIGRTFSVDPLLW